MTYGLPHSLPVSPASAGGVPTRSSSFYNRYGAALNARSGVPHSAGPLSNSFAARHGSSTTAPGSVVPGMSPAVGIYHNHSLTGGTDTSGHGGFHHHHSGHGNSGQGQFGQNNSGQTNSPQSALPIIIAGNTAGLGNGSGSGPSGPLGGGSAGLIGGGGGGSAGNDDLGFTSFGGGRFPGAVFGFGPGDLRSRAISATGGFGSLSYGMPQAAASVAPAAPSPAASSATTASAGDKVVQGEAAFRSDNYQGAIDDWRQAVADGHSDPLVQMMLGQAYFAAGSYQDAAATTQAAMHALPKDRWGIVVSNRNELYSAPGKYRVQLQKLKNAVFENPTDPALRFLLGFHYACLNDPRPAIAQLDQAIAVDPHCDMAEPLRDVLRDGLHDADVPVITPAS